MKPSYPALVLGLVGACLLTLARSSWAMPPSDEFDLSRHRIPLDQIVSGGPGKDGIPAILKPLFVRAPEATFLADEDRILGLSRGRDTKAYPVKILNWHEIVNDLSGSQPVVITYCPLCGTGIGFEAVVQGQPLTFGVSGLLYQSDLLMYDHQTEGLWSQIAMAAVTGPMAGTKLTPLFLEHTTWEDWRQHHPETLVLSTQTGHHRDYNRDPYLGYAQRPDLMFAVTHVDRRYHPKEWVLGVEVNGLFKAYPFTELKRARSPLQDRVNGRPIQIHFNPRALSASVTDSEGRPLPSMMAFWFAWTAFHPDTIVFTTVK